MRRVRGRTTAGPLLAVLLVGLLAVSLGHAGTGPTSRAATPGPEGVPAAPSTVVVAPGLTPAPGVTDEGAVGGNVTLTVDVGLPSRDPAGLAAFVNATSVPGTPIYRHFLSAGAADARFGALPQTVASAEGYFDGLGLAASVHPDGLLLSVSGPGPTVGRAFGTSFDLYRTASGATFVSHPTTATLPSVVPWTGAFGLDSAEAFEPEVAVAGAAVPVAPATGCSSTVYLDPCQVASAYDYPWLSGGANGSGRTIAVIDAYSSEEPQSELASDFAQFTSDAGLPSGGLSFAYPVPPTSGLNSSGANSAWKLEDALDLEWARASAPGAAVEMVFSPNPGAGLYFALDWVVSERAADVVSMSWGEPEVGVYNASTTPCSSACNASTDGSFAVLNPVLQLAAAEGISTFAASGDCGAADGTSGVAVNYPASDPYVTGVGATNLTVGPGGTYGSESGWGGNSSGAHPPGCQNLGGSGGGYSVLPRPWWQSGEGTVPSRGRGVPDVSIVGGNLHPVGTVVGGVTVPLAGTSVSTPIWAGIAATADEVHGSDLGLLDPSFYEILRNSSYASDLHDVETGWNGYSAHAGWNPVTGVGTPIVAPLLADLGASVGAVSSLTTYAYASPRFGPAPLTVRFAVSVKGGSGAYPLEGIDFGDGNASTVVGGTANHTFVSPGVYSVQSYVVDSSGNTSSSPPVVVVAGGGTALTVALSANSTAPAVGAPIAFTATVSGGTAPFLYNFSFGDGTFTDNLTTSSAAHAYPAVGTFCAEVVVSDSLSRPDGAASLRLPVSVGGAPARTCGDPSASLSLTGNTTEPVRDAPADFPSLFSSAGGSTAPDDLPTQVALAAVSPLTPYTAACECAIFRSPGTYTVEEWENDTVDEQAMATATVSVAPALVATFNATTLAGPVPLAVTFSATASGGDDASASATHWSFGDGSGATGSSVTATYATVGEYVAIASLSDRGFGNASEAFVIDAEAMGSSAVGLTGTILPAVNLSSGTTVHWNATAVGPASALAGDVVAWNLGNGGSGFGPTANETYTAPVDLLAGNELLASVALDGPRLTPVLKVLIPLPDFFATEAGGFVPAADALQVSEEVYPAAGVVPLLVAGSATTSGPGGVAVTWLFGDNRSGAGPSVSNVYYGAGDFTVRLQAFDGFGDLSDRTDTVVAGAALTLSGCGPRTRQGVAPYTLDLGPTPSGGAGPPYTFRWALPNGTASTATNVSLRFTSAGTYVVTLVVSDAAQAMYGCAWSITVTSLPAVSFFEVLGGGAAAGVGLAVFFLWATRPRPVR